MKKRILAILCSFLILCMPITSSATSMVSMEQSLEESLVTYPPNSVIGINDANKPTKLWDIASSGQYDFSGSSDSQELYTKYYFAGKTSYTIHVKQGGTNSIRIRCISYAGDKVLQTETLGADDNSITFTITTKESFYLEFYSPFLFWGTSFNVASGSYIK